MEYSVTRDVETITTEILVIRDNVVNQVRCAAFEIGKRLIEVKAQVPSGEWLGYLENKLGYKSSTAENMMRIYRDFSDRPQFADFDQSQLVAMFGLNQSQQMQLLEENPDLSDKSSREIKRLAKQLKEAEEAAAAAQKEAQRERKARENADKIAVSAADDLEKLRQAQKDREQHIADLENELDRVRSEPVEIVSDPLQQEKIDSLERELQAMNAKAEELSAERNRAVQEKESLTRRLAADDISLQIQYLYKNVLSDLDMISGLLPNVPQSVRSGVCKKITRALAGRISSIDEMGWSDD